MGFIRENAEKMNRERRGALVLAERTLGREIAREGGALNRAAGAERAPPDVRLESLERRATAERRQARTGELGLP